MSGPQDVEITWGETAVFTCHVEGDPHPNIIWMHEEKELDMKTNKYEIMGDGSLMVKNTQDTDSGHYLCMAKNPDGEAKSRPARMSIIASNNVHHKNISKSQ